MKEKIVAAAAVMGAIASQLFGGWTAGLSTLVIFMAIDYASGLIVAGVFHKSQKSENGKLESRSCQKGLVRKGMMLAIVLVAYRLDVTANTNWIKDATCVGFIVNEAISIVENAGLMGIKLPKAVNNAIEIMEKKLNTDGKEPERR